MTTVEITFHDIFKPFGIFEWMSNSLFVFCCYCNYNDGLYV